MPRLHRLLATLALLVAATAVCAAPALARKHDHDKLPDRWERKFHLNLKQNDANRDRDRDGLSNYGEYRSHTNPRKKDTDRDGLKDGAERRFGFKPRDRDSDNDGTKDGKENAGKISTLSGSAITIRLATGGKLIAGLGDDLAVACKPTGSDDGSGAADTGDDPAENPADDPESDDAGDLSSTGGQEAEGGDEAPETGVLPGEPEGTPDDADFDKQFDEAFAGGQTCDASSLKKGSLVHEATVDRSGPAPVVTAIKLVR